MKSIERFIEGQAFTRWYDSPPRPPQPPPPPRKHARPATHRKTEKERQLVDGIGGEGDGRGAESYDHKKAWSSINHSIISCRCAKSYQRNVFPVRCTYVLRNIHAFPNVVEPFQIFQDMKNISTIFLSMHTVQKRFSDFPVPQPGCRQPFFTECASWIFFCVQLHKVAADTTKTYLLRAGKEIRLIVA